MDLNDITPEQLKAFQNRNLEIMEINIKQANEAALLANETAIKCVNEFDLPNLVQTTIIANASNFLDTREILNNLGESYKTVSKTSLTLYETNAGLKEANTILTDTIAAMRTAYDSLLEVKNVQMKNLSIENERLKKQSTWEFIRNKLK